MTPEIPSYLLSTEATLRPVVAAIALGLIWLGAARMPAPARTRYATGGVLSAVFAIWLGIAQSLGAANVYFAGTGNAVPTVILGLLVPVLIAFAGLRFSRNIASLVSAIPLHWLVAAQVYRVGGGIFLVLLAAGRLPWQFALPAGIGDFTTGCLAVIVALRLARTAAGARKAAYAWSWFGIGDLVLALAMGAMTSPGRVHILALGAPNLLVSSYPLVMVPTFAVPLALMLHGLVLLRLRHEPRASGVPAVA